MEVVAEQALVAGRKIVVAFLGLGKARADERAVASLLGINLNLMDIRQYDHTSALLDGTKVLATEGIKLDLVVSLSDHWMSHGNSTVLREHAGAEALLYLNRGQDTLLISVNDRIAIVRFPRTSNASEFRTIFGHAARLGGWPEILTPR